MKHSMVRIGARAIILHENRLLLVNAYPEGQSDLWCAPGGGVERGTSLPDNIAREVYEETGLTVHVGAPCLVNEFHDPASGFHQIDVFFRCSVVDGAIDPAWQDPEGIVTQRRFFTRDEVLDVRFKPDSLARVAWGETPLSYDPLEEIVK